jgi:hypothetical protein
MHSPPGRIPAPDHCDRNAASVSPSFIDVIPSQCKTQAPSQINALTVDAKGSYDNQPTLDVIRQQRYKGGVRLAALLNAL